jgi:hypothetical protein
LALQNIAKLYRIPFEPKPKRTDPISITREEFYEAYENLAREGVPVRVDREMAWEDFAGWRVNYDTVLVALAGLLMAPPAQWSSDRSTIIRRRKLHKKVK